MLGAASVGVDRGDVRNAAAEENTSMVASSKGPFGPSRVGLSSLLQYPLLPKQMTSTEFQ